MGSNMIIKLKKKSLRVLSKTILTTQVLFFFFIIFFGCRYDPVTMIPMTPEEICTYMNEHFEGDFELLYSKSEDNSAEKSNSAYMKCSLFDDREILTKHGYTNSVLGWHKTFLTNYNDIYYRADVEKRDRQNYRLDSLYTVESRASIRRNQQRRMVSVQLRQTTRHKYRDQS